MTPSDSVAREDAYRRFESPAQERDKFTRRLLKLGAHGWRCAVSPDELTRSRGWWTELLSVAWGKLWYVGRKPRSGGQGGGAAVRPLA